MKIRIRKNGTSSPPPATGPPPGAFRSFSHIWHRARHSIRQSGSSSFVSLSACCLPCLITKPINPPPPSPSSQDQAIATTTPPFAIRRIEFASSSEYPPELPIGRSELARAPQSYSHYLSSPATPPKLLVLQQPNGGTPSEAVTPVALSSLPSTAPSSPVLPPSSLSPPPQRFNMAERTLQQILNQLRSNPGLPYAEASSLLSKAKIQLLQLKAATPGAPGSTGGAASPQHLALARDVYEQGALFSIRARNPDAFTRYVSQLQPFYELPGTATGGERNKVTGLYLLLLLTQGRYAEFHSELETLGTRAKESGAGEIEGDRFLGYSINLERWLMEGSYDRVWKALKSREVPSEEYGVFSEILTSQIRSEIASSSERAYPSLPLSSTKSLLFLDSEGAVVDFARHRGWVVRDGNIYFPTSAATVDGEPINVASSSDADAGEEQEFSRMVIENALGYARELETIV
ncbi:SAC3/GANP/Nin1/mts3/eIF-3 p25 family-domain-containing protein [Daldinia vernicosa]|uniref:SAC3/GANP/Nin1/mts3/eIF-3 p25 family-domain-containing protein n=1 Tax=Daldinia vernicosa TaxID=114800 RepID=UPI002008C6EF|nr:SAC3/GANP/Nin1/mts3/eIF-3 p25 family-domain-containing protein [Daldinia vernicosa]KAI0848828.1 SAC3/GANP/Nin1/mts3/eIF-3 p25 family-domain-containing protein [Daldinia vernicosa]